MKDFQELFFILWVMLVIWAAIDTYLMLRTKGKLRRGVKIGSQSLSPEIRDYLNDISEEIVMRNALGGVYAWILKKENERLIWTNAGGSKYVNFVGYVDFQKQIPKLDFRISLPVLLFIISLSWIIILLPFIFIGFYSKRKAIYSFIEKQYNNNQLQIYESEYSVG